MHQKFERNARIVERYDRGDSYYQIAKDEGISQSRVIQICESPEIRAVRVAFTNMRQRCNNPKSINYAAYGGRGIRVCKSWKNFYNFLADMGLKPDLSYVLMLKDKNGNYEPGNCEWAPFSKLYVGRKKSIEPRKYLVGGELLTVKEIASRLGTSLNTIYHRKRRGVSFDQLLESGTTKRFSAPLTKLWPYPDEYEYRRSLVIMWRKMGVPLRVCGALLGVTRERARQIGESNPHPRPIGRPQKISGAAD